MLYDFFIHICTYITSWHAICNQCKALWKWWCFRSLIRLVVTMPAVMFSNSNTVSVSSGEWKLTLTVFHLNVSSTNYYTLWKHGNVFNS